jgi:tRNA A-37 threonylcarbamoyl transferase component Bud32
MVPQDRTSSNVPLPQSRTLAAGRARARTVPGIAAGLQALLHCDAATWRERGFEVQKQRTVRTVLRGAIDGVPVHVKVFRADTLADRARDAMRGPRGDRELDHLLRARALGLPAVEPLAAGLAIDGDTLRAFVVTRTVVGARQFTFAEAPPVQASVGSLLRRMHDGGVLPGDLHPGNLVVDPDGRPWLLDLTSVRYGGEPDLRRRARGLAFFCHELDAGALDPAARPLLAAYLAAGTALPAGLRDELVLATRRWRADALPAFGRRCSRPCRHTDVAAHRRGEPRWYWHVPTAGQAETALRASCRAFVAAPPPPDKAGRRGAVWLRDAFVAKQREQGAAQKLWRASYWLLFAGVPQAAPIALATRAGRGHVFAERLANVPLAAELAAGRLDDAALAAAARALGAAVGRLHAHGLRNRDLKLENLVRDPATGRVCTVDLDGVRRRSVEDARGQGADLGRLLAAFRAAGAPGGPATERAFLRAYLRARRDLLQPAPVRRLVRRARARAREWKSAHAGAGRG